MASRFLVQIEAQVAERLERVLRQRLEAIGLGVVELEATHDGILGLIHLRLGFGEHPLDAHQRIKRGLGAFSLRTRWLDLEEIAWEKDIRDSIDDFPSRPGSDEGNP